jgi:hypothetical protein
MLTESFDVTFKNNLDPSGELIDPDKLGVVVTQISQITMVKTEDEKGIETDSPQLVTLLGVVFPNNLGYTGPIKYFSNEELVFLGLTSDRVDDEDDLDDTEDADDIEDVDDIDDGLE